MQKIQAAMIKGAKKAESWRRKWSAIGKVTWIPQKNAHEKGFLM